MSPEDRAAEIAALAAMSDGEIDTVNIPEANEDSWRLARRGGGRPTAKQSVTLNVDQETVGRFKAQHPDGGYQSAMTEALAEHTARSKPPAPRVKAAS